jgi:hypothetical protein
MGLDRLKPMATRRCADPLCKISSNRLDTASFIDASSALAQTHPTFLANRDGGLLTATRPELQRRVISRLPENCGAFSEVLSRSHPARQGGTRLLTRKDPIRVLRRHPACRGGADVRNQKSGYESRTTLTSRVGAGPSGSASAAATPLVGVERTFITRNRATRVRPRPARRGGARVNRSGPHPDGIPQTSPHRPHTDTPDACPGHKPSC